MKPQAKSPATDKQIAYARDLGLEFPDTINKWEMSQLLDCHLSRQIRADETLVSWAQALRVPATRYIGGERLLTDVMDLLRGRTKDLVAWFGYWVARDVLTPQQLASDFSSPFAPLLQNIATYLEDDAKVLASIRRYNGDSLKQFGEFKSDDGSISTGASRRTAAFARVSDLIKESIQTP
jgi:hypothetical protein